MVFWHETIYQNDVVLIFTTLGAMVSVYERLIATRLYSSTCKHANEKGSG